MKSNLKRIFIFLILILGIFLYKIINKYIYRIYENPLKLSTSISNISKIKRVQYFSGKLELEYLEFIKTVNRSEKFAKEYCSQFYSPRRKRIKRLKEDIHNCNYNIRCFGEEFSYFITNKNEFEYIEPLFGFFREYDYHCDRRSDLDYYLLIGNNITNRDTIYFDLGATTFNCQAQQLFYHSYKRLGYNFIHWYLWEIIRMNPKEIFDPVPEDLFSIYHYYNIPVPVDINNAKHPFNIILRHSYNKSYVAMKLDIDTPELELKIFNLLLDSDEYNDILDELFFEYHFELKDFGAWYKVLFKFISIGWCRYDL